MRSQCRELLTVWGVSWMRLWRWSRCRRWRRIDRDYDLCRIRAHQTPTGFCDCESGRVIAAVVVSVIDRRRGLVGRRSVAKVKMIIGDGVCRGRGIRVIRARSVEMDG